MKYTFKIWNIDWELDENLAYDYLNMTLEDEQIDEVVDNLGNYPQWLIEETLDKIEDGLPTEMTIDVWGEEDDNLEEDIDWEIQSQTGVMTRGFGYELINKE